MNSSKKSADKNVLVFGIMKGVLAGVGAAAALMLIAAAIAYGTPDPGRLTEPLGYAVLALSALCGGIFSVRFTGDGILSGLIFGSAMSLLFWALSIIPVGWESTLSAGISALMHLVPCAAGTLGALIGKKRAPKRRRHKSQKR